MIDASIQIEDGGTSKQDASIKNEDEGTSK